MCIWFFLKGHRVSDRTQNMSEFCAHADQQLMKTFLLKTSKTHHGDVRQNKEIFILNMPISFEITISVGKNK